MKEGISFGYEPTSIACPNHKEGSLLKIVKLYHPELLLQQKLAYKRKTSVL